VKHHDPSSSPAPAADQPPDHSVLSLLNSAAAHLGSLRFEEARLHVEWMLARVLGLKRLDLYLQFDRPLTRDEVSRFKALYRRRLDHEPLQYILGDTEFLGYRFLVDRRVLIPRPETEILAERAVELLRGQGRERPRVLDIGTGCGNIAVSVAAMVPGSEVTAIDLSPGALEVAAANAERLLPGRVEFLQGDIRQEILTDRSFDLILANPPYIPLTDYEHLQPEVLGFEPREALTDGGDGTLFLERILVFASARLVDGGTVLMELGSGQDVWSARRAREVGLVSAIVHPDHAAIPRVLEARRRDAAGAGA
jgi:release factor glutamine methyltransferase